MLTFQEFERQYRGENRKAIREKYVSALFRFGQFGGLVSFFGNGKDLPIAKRHKPEENIFRAATTQTVFPSARAFVHTLRPHPSTARVTRSRAATGVPVTPPLFRPDQVDEYGFVKSIDIRACDLPAHMLASLPSVSVAASIKSSYNRNEDDSWRLWVDRETKTNTYTNTTRPSWRLNKLLGRVSTRSFVTISLSRTRSG